MPITRIASTKGFGQNGYTATGIDTTGANLLIWTTADNGGAAPTLTDTYNNTWVLIQRYVPIAVATSMYYCLSAVVGSSHTFTCNKATGANSGQIRAYSGVKTTGALDQSNANLAFGTTTIQPGSITPSENDELIITAYEFDNDSALPTINSGFGNIVGDIGSGGTYLGSVSADLIQGTAAAINPTWTRTSSNNNYAIISSFRAAPAVPAASIGYRLTMAGDRVLTMPGDFLTLMGGAPSGATKVLKRWNGSAWISVPQKRWNGSTWVAATLKAT